MAVLEYTTVEGAVGTVEIEGMAVDGDGTLFDGYEQHCAGVRERLLTEAGFVCPGFEDLRGKTGRGVLDAIRDAQAEELRPTLLQAWANIVSQFQTQVDGTSVAMHRFSDAADFFAGLELPATVTTNARRANLERRLAVNPDVGGWINARFSVVTVCCVGGVAKPDPAMLHLARERMDVSQLAYVGDGLPDALAGSAAGIPTFILARGRNFKEMQSFAEIPRVQIVADFTAFRLR